MILEKNTQIGTAIIFNRSPSIFVSSRHRPLITVSSFVLQFSIFLSCDPKTVLNLLEVGLLLSRLSAGFCGPCIAFLTPLQIFICGVVTISFSNTFSRIKVPQLYIFSRDFSLFISIPVPTQTVASTNRIPKFTSTKLYSSSTGDDLPLLTSRIIVPETTTGREIYFFP